jgi:E3 ubiquitin-protein ligase HUWE1
VLHASLQVLIRPSQQYLYSTPFEPGQSPDAIQRLLILARGWEKLESRGSLAFIASSEDYTPPDEPVTITFYPTTGNKGAAMTVDLSGLDPNSPHDQLAQLGEEHGIPLEDRFAALCKLRLAHMTDLATRRKLLAIRLYAMGSYGE